MNYLRTAILLAGLTALFMAVGYLIGGQSGMLLALIVACAMNLFTYWNGDRMVLSMTGAQEVDERSAPEFVGLVRELAGRAGLPMPRVYIMQEAQPNAFATGRNPQHSAVCASTGLLEMCTREEIAGVMAHELAHIKNYDILTMTITATIAGAISMLAQFGLMFGGGHRDNSHGGGLGVVGSILLVILAPIAAMIVQMAISRTREYAADRDGAELTRHPLGLASALGKLDRAAHQIENQAAELNPATAHLFIINPLSGARMDNLFSTHPATENRIAALQELARSMGDTGYAAPAARAGSYARPQPWGTRSRGPWGTGSRAGPWG